MTARRNASYQWRLRNVMADRGMFSTTQLVPHLAERGITRPAGDRRPRDTRVAPSGQGGPGCAPAGEPLLPHARAVRALAHPRLRPLRPPRRPGRELARRAAVPYLLSAGSAHPGVLPRV